MSESRARNFFVKWKRAFLSALGLSILCHLLLIGWGLLSFSANSVEAAPEDYVPVDVVSDDMHSQLTKGMKSGDKNEKKQLAEKIADAKPIDEAVGKIAKEEVKTETAPEAKPAEKPPEKPVEKKPDPPKPVVEKPKDEPKKDEAKQVDQKKDEKKDDPIAEQLKKDQAKQPPKQEIAKQPPQPPKPKERKFDQNQIAALLDKRDPSREAVAGSELNPKSSLGVSAGTAPKLTMGWVGALQDRIRQCWAVPAGIRDAEDIQVRVYFEMNPNGTVVGQPQLLGGPPNSLGPVVGESAIRAIQQCQPYTFLPQAEYKGGWDKIDITFSTKEMFRR